MTDFKSSAIVFDNLTKIYRSDFLGKKQIAVNQLSFSVPVGSVFGFLGANGAGKTTSIKILMGLQFATSGSLRVWDRQRIGYLPERPNFHGDITGNEFLNFHRNLFGTQTKKNPGKSNEQLLELVGIPHVGDQLLREFSKGMLQRIGIAQALVNSPDLIILDEPMSGLDPVGRRDVRILIDNLSKEGRTIFFSTHILSDVETLCNQIAFLEKGVLKACGPLEKIIQSQQSHAKEIIFEGINENTIKNSNILMNSKKFGIAWKILLEEPGRLQPVVETIWANKGMIISVTSPQVSLESILFPVSKSDIGV